MPRPASTDSDIAQKKLRACDGERERERKREKGGEEREGGERRERGRVIA